MEPDVGIGAGGGPANGPVHGQGPQRPGPGIVLRVVEGAGLLTLVWGIGNGPWWLVPCGAVLILGSYAVYRRRHGGGDAGGSSSGGSDPGIGDSDGGGD